MACVPPRRTPIDLGDDVRVLRILRVWPPCGAGDDAGVCDRITGEFVRYLLSYRLRHLPRVLHSISEHGHNTTVLHLRGRRAGRKFLADTRRRHDLGSR